MDEDQVDIDPLFIGMTRPPIFWGVPMEFFGINFIIFGVGIIAFTSLLAKLGFVILICVPLHVIAYVLTEREPHWMGIYLIKMAKCAPTRNRIFWKTNSYKP